MYRFVRRAALPGWRVVTLWEIDGCHTASPNPHPAAVVLAAGFLGDLLLARVQPVEDQRVMISELPCSRP